MIGVRSGWLFASANSDLFTFVQDHLTVDRKDFNAPAIGVDVEVAMTPAAERHRRVRLSRARARTRSTATSSTTSCCRSTRRLIGRKELNLSGSVRLALLPSGRRISRFAWIPRTVTPYVGAGAGPPSSTSSSSSPASSTSTRAACPFDDSFTSKGWAPSVHALGGVDVRVFRKPLHVTVEGRYTWVSSAPLSNDFVDFEPLGLAGFKATAGLHYMF